MPGWRGVIARWWIGRFRLKKTLAWTDLPTPWPKGILKFWPTRTNTKSRALHVETLHDAVNDAFDNVGKISFHMAAPIFGRKDSEGKPVKTQFGPWMFSALKVLAKLKRLRGTPLDVFGYSAERRSERKAIKAYQKLADELIKNLTPANFGLAAELARLPLKVRGFGHVKEANAQAVAKEQAGLLAQFRAPDTPTAQAAE